MTRGTAGEASIYRTSDGRWRGALVLATGERRYLSGTTRGAVSTKRREVLRAVDAGQPITSRKAKTLGFYLERWLNSTLPARVAAGRLSPETLTSYSHKARLSYAHKARLHIVPHLGHLRMDEITPPVLRAWIVTLLNKRGASSPGLLRDNHRSRRSCCRRGPSRIPPLFCGPR